MDVINSFIEGVIQISSLWFIGWIITIFMTTEDEEKLSHRLHTTLSIILCAMTEKVISFFEPGDIKRKRKDHEEYNWALLRMTDGEISPSDYYEKYRKLRKAMERLSFEKQKWINEATPLWCNGVIKHEYCKYYNYKNKDLRVSFTEIYEKSEIIKEALKLKGITKEEWINNGENVKKQAYEFNEKWIDEHRFACGKAKDHLDL